MYREYRLTTRNSKPKQAKTVPGNPPAAIINSEQVDPGQTFGRVFAKASLEYGPRCGRQNIELIFSPHLFGWAL